MHFRLLFLLLYIFSLHTNSLSATWLGCTPTNRFSPLQEISLQTDSAYREQLVPYLMARGVHDEASIEHLYREDLFHIAHALSILFEQDQTTVLQNLLGDHFSLTEGYTTQIDHVGRELFGPISFYIPYLQHIAERLDLILVRHIVFPSTQVVKVLQEHDPSLQGVTIGRIYFQSIATGTVKCIELFQAAPLNEQLPQHIDRTKERLALLTASTSSSSVTPIDHLAIELGSVDEIQRIHDHIQRLASETLLPYQKEVSQNASDGSTQTKVSFRDSQEAPFNKIIEFVHYS